MSVLGNFLKSEGFEVDDRPVYGRPASVPWQGVQWIMLHHYAGSEDPSDAPRQAEYAKTASGRYPPLCQLYLDVTGKVWVISKERPGQPSPGRASHAGVGSYPGIPTNRGNEVSLGIEVQESGDSKVAAHPVVYDAMIRLTASLLKFYNLPATRVIDHEDYARSAQGKIDLLDDTADIRRDVLREMVKQARPRKVLDAQVFGDVIDRKSDHRKVFEALPQKDKRWKKIIVLGDLVHRNSPKGLWEREWVPTYGSLPTCKVWSVLGNHGWGWSGGGRFEAPKGRTYWKYRKDFHKDCTMSGVKRPKFSWVKLRPGWLILGLDSEHPLRSRRFMNRMVRKFGKDRKVLVLIHRPPIPPPGSKAPPFKGKRFKRDIARHADLVMAGHSHRFWRTRRGGVEYVVAGTGDGKGWADLKLFDNGDYSVKFVRA